MTALLSWVAACCQSRRARSEVYILWLVARERRTSAHESIVNITVSWQLHDSNKSQRNVAMTFTLCGGQRLLCLFILNITMLEEYNCTLIIKGKRVCSTWTTMIGQCLSSSWKYYFKSLELYVFVRLFFTDYCNKCYLLFMPLNICIWEVLYQNIARSLNWFDLIVDQNLKPQYHKIRQLSDRTV